jgi:hypothetical protein
MSELNRNITSHNRTMLRDAKLFECLKFTYKYDSAVKAFHYAHGGNHSTYKHSKLKKEEWDAVVAEIGVIVKSDADRKAIKVQVYSYATGSGLFGGGSSGFVFSVRGKIVGFHVWDAWIS